MAKHSSAMHLGRVTPKEIVVVIADGAQATVWKKQHHGRASKVAGDFHVGDASKAEVKCGGGVGAAVPVTPPDFDDAHIWKTDEGIVVLDFSHGVVDYGAKPKPLKATDRRTLAAVGARIAALPVASKPRVAAKVEIESGCVAIFDPIASPAFTAKTVAAVAASSVPREGRGFLLLPVEPGPHVITMAFLGSRSGWHFDDLGMYRKKIVITKRRPAIT